MKKLISSVAVATTLLAANASAGMIVDFEAGTGIWYGETTGDMNYKTGATSTTIDFEDDLGLEQTTNGYFYADFNHFVPFVPNIRVERQNYKTDGNDTISRNLTFGGQTFTANQKVATDLQLNQSDLILYWGVPGLKTLTLGHAGVDFGVSIKKFDGYAKLNSENVDVDFTVPMGYLAANVKIPFLATKLSASTKVISYKGSSLNDTMVKATFTLPIPIPAIDINAEVGYKTQTLDITDDLSDDFNAEITNSGMFAGISAKF